MARRNPAAALAAYRRGREPRGEVRIGAYARRRQRRQLLLALLGTGLIGGAIGVYWSLRPQARAAGASYAVKVGCVSCGQVGRLTVGAGQKFPLVCPACGERAAWPLWKCRACGHEFVPRATSEQKRCPACGSLAVGSAAVP